MPAPSIRTTATNSGTGTSATVTWPAVNANEIAMFAVASDLTNSWSWPSGTEIAEVTQGGSAETTLGLAWIRCTGSESGTFTVTLGTSRDWKVYLIILQDCITSGTPYEVGSYNQGAATPAASNAMITTGVDRLGVIFYAAREGWLLGATPATWTQSIASDTTNPVRAVDYKTIPTATTEASAGRATTGTINWVTWSAAFLPVASASAFRPYLILG